MPSQVSDHLDSNEKKDHFQTSNESPHSRVSFNNGYYENYTDDDDKENDLGETREDSMFVNPNEYDYVYENEEDVPQVPEEDPYTYYVNSPNMKFAWISLACAVVAVLVLLIFRTFLCLILVAASFVFSWLTPDKTIKRPLPAKISIGICVGVVVLSPWILAL